MKKSWGLAARISVAVLIAALLSTAALVFFSFNGERKGLEEAADQAARTAASALKLEVGRVARDIEKLTSDVSQYGGFSSRWVLYKDSVESRRLYSFLGERLPADPNVLGLGVLIDPQSWEQEPGEQKCAPFVVRSGDHYAVADLAEFDADYVVSQTYTLAKESGRAVWGSPFFSSDANRGAVTCAYPFEHGVVLCDVATGWLNEAASRLDIPYGGGILVKAADSRTLVNTAALAQVPDLSQPVSGDLARADVGGEPFVYFSTTAPETGWSIAVFFPSNALRQVAQGATRPVALAGGAAALVLTALAFLLATGATRALDRLNEAVLLMKTDGMSSPVPDIKGGGEIEALSRSLETMRSTVNDRVEALRTELLRTEGDRREAELAGGMREHMVKGPFPDDAKYSLSVLSDPGKPQGGDFCDFLLTDRGSVYLLVGRLSSTGIAASVTSNSLLSYLRATLSAGTSPAIAMNTVGAFFERGGWRQPAELEIRLLLVEFYPSTGTCTLTSAGVGRPLLIRDEAASYLEMAEGLPLRSDRQSCTTGIANLAKGDRVVFYTGAFAGTIEREDRPIPVTEAIAQLSSADGLADVELLEKMAAMRRTQADSPPDATEDVTLLLLRYK